MNTTRPSSGPALLLCVLLGAPQEAARILAEAIDLAHQGRIDLLQPKDK